MFTLRELSKNDVPIINKMRSSRELIDRLGAPYRFINIETDNNWFESYQNNRSTNVRCCIIDESDKVIGLVSLTQINHINQSTTLHIMLGDSGNRNQGAGSYATNEILRHAFYDLNLNRVELTVIETNDIAIKFYTKLGFKKEGIKREAVYKNNSLQDMIVMAMLKKEFADLK